MTGWGEAEWILMVLGVTMELRCYDIVLFKCESLQFLDVMVHGPGTWAPQSILHGTYIHPDNS